LGNVINALTTPGRAHIPYRDSKLTRLLQDSLGGNAFTCVVCCVSPASTNYEESLASLRFADRARKVKNVARLGVDPTAARIAALLEETRMLRARVAALEGALVRRGVSVDAAALAAEAKAAGEVVHDDDGGAGKGGRTGTKGQGGAGKGGCIVM
jgi:hypothetical protein